MLHRLRAIFGARRMQFSAWQVEITTRCALACRMCVRAVRPWHAADMRLHDFNRLVPHLDAVSTVVLQGWGEPLLHPDLIAFVHAVKAGRRGPSTGFVTSGIGLDRRRALELVDAGLDFIGFSIAGSTSATHAHIRVGSELSQVIAAAEHVRAAKHDRRRRRPRVHLVYLMLKSNVHELPALPDLARQVGAQEVVLTNLVDVADEWQDGQKVFGPAGDEAYGALLGETERRARDRHLEFRASALCPSVTPVCGEDPLRNLYVTVDGEVAPCVYACPPVQGELTRWYSGREHLVDRLSFGNAFRDTPQAIWDSPEYVAFRDRFRARERSGIVQSILRSTQAPDGTAALDLPDAPPICRRCHRLQGV